MEAASCCAGNRGNRTVTIFDVEKNRVVAHLPVAVTPENFCFKAANDGEIVRHRRRLDALVVIYPYQSEVYETGWWDVSWRGWRFRARRVSVRGEHRIG